MQQVPVRAVNLQHVETGRLRPCGGPGPGLDHAYDFALSQRVRNRRSCVGGQRAGRDWLPGLPVFDRGAGAAVALKRLAAFPRPLHARLAAGVSELDAGGRAALMQQVDDARKARHEGIVPQAEIANRAAAAALDLGRLDHHQAGATGGVAAGIHDVPVGGAALVRRILVHRRHHHAVFQVEIADRERGEEQRLGHGSAS